MNLQPSRRTTIAVVGFAAVAVVALALWYFAPTESESLAESPGTSEPVMEEIGESAIAESPEVPADSGNQVQPAKRIVHVPDTRKPQAPGSDLDPTNVTAAELGAFASQALERALEGDLAVAPNLAYLVNGCSHSVPLNASALEEFVAQFRQMTQRSEVAGDPVPPEGRVHNRLWPNPPGFEIRRFPTDQLNRLHLSEWMQGCLQVLGRFNEDTRKELEHLARNGNVIARYLYAMWRPRLTLASDALERLIEWQINALEFSYANLEEGQIAGVLAFSESYSSALFTGFDFGLSLAMKKAAWECGVDSDELREFLGSYGDEQITSLHAGVLRMTREEFERLVTSFAERCR